MSNELTPEDIKMIVRSFQGHQFPPADNKDGDIDLILDSVFLEYIITREGPKLYKVVDFIAKTGGQSEQIQNLITDEKHIYYFKYLWWKYIAFLDKLSHFYNYAERYMVEESDLELLHMQLLNDFYRIETYSIVAKHIDSGEIKKLPYFNELSPDLPEKLPDWNFKEELTKYLIQEGVI